MTDPTTIALAREVLALAEKAMPAPWTFDDSDDCWRLHGTGRIIPAHGSIPEQRVTLQILKAPKRNTPYAEYWPDPADADFIAHTRTSAPALARALLQAQEEKDAMFNHAILLAAAAVDDADVATWQRGMEGGDDGRGTIVNARSAVLALLRPVAPSEKDSDE